MCANNAQARGFSLQARVPAADARKEKEMQQMCLKSEMQARACGVCWPACLQQICVNIEVRARGRSLQERVAALRVGWLEGAWTTVESGFERLRP